MLLIILCGIPGSGKTSLAVSLARALETDFGFSTVVVDPDKVKEMIPALNKSFDPKRERLVNKLTSDLIEEGLEKKNIVISDDLNYYESARHRLIQIARKHRSKYVIIYLSVSTKVAEKRNATREKPIPAEIIQQIVERFDPPGLKYRWDNPALTIDTEKLSIEDAAKLAVQVVMSKVKEGHEVGRRRAPTRLGSEIRRQETTRSAAKRSLDESTRRVLNELLSSGELKPKFSEEANGIRRKFLKDALERLQNIEDAEQEFKSMLREHFRKRQYVAS